MFLYLGKRAYYFLTENIENIIGENYGEENNASSICKLVFIDMQKFTIDQKEELKNYNCTVFYNDEWPSQFE